MEFRDAPATSALSMMWKKTLVVNVKDHGDDADARLLD